MNEHTKKMLLGILLAIIFIVCIILVVVGQKHVGPAGLAVMLLGLVGLVLLLWLYNRQYQ